MQFSKCIDEADEKKVLFLLQFIKRTQQFPESHLQVDEVGWMREFGID
jgi:hypothetical protein